MEWNMMLKRILATLGVAAVIAAGLAGGGVSAASASEGDIGAPRATAGDRLEGPWTMYNMATALSSSSKRIAVTADLKPEYLPGEEARSVAVRASFPALGTTGPVVVNGLCVTKDVPSTAMPTWWEVALAECVGSPEQMYEAKPSRHLVPVTEPTQFLQLWHDRVMIYNDSDDYDEWLDVKYLTSIQTAPLVASVSSVDSDARSAVVGGTGEPGATITVESPNGSVETTVDPEGKWSVSVPNLSVGDNALHVTQLVHGVASGEANLNATIVKQLQFTAQIDGIDHGAKTATVSGKGEPGATVTLTTPTGSVEFVVDVDGNWAGTITGLAEGVNVVPATQNVGGVDSAPIELTIIVDELAVPVVEPLAAGGLGLLMIAVGVAARARRQKLAAELS
ncbi:Ig-like domain-containing protein [Leucobacter albus]|uniref:Ig-like domain-containing protein n=1 Tax=Leucobacter albus TaxID=272210 RepID=A0ABW3TM60_9MICO